MKFLVPLFLIAVMLATVACKKETIDFSLTEHTEQKIVGEGYFTDSLKKHKFTFISSNNLGSTEVIYVNEVSLIVKTPEGPISFTNIGNGTFESETPFKGAYGSNYTIQFSYKGNVHEVVTVMPTPVEVNSYDFLELDSIFGGFLPGEVELNISSDLDQYLKFDLFIADQLQLPEDTVWMKTKLPTYRIVEIPAGDSIIVTLPIETDDSYYISENDLVKLKTYIISKDVGAYLIKLRSYVTSELVNSQYYNPPYYYSNGAYGLGYGTLMDSTIYQY